MNAPTTKAKLTVSAAGIYLYAAGEDRYMISQMKDRTWTLSKKIEGEFVPVLRYLDTKAMAKAFLDQKVGA